MVTGIRTASICIYIWRSGPDVSTSRLPADHTSEPVPPRGGCACMQMSQSINGRPASYTSAPATTLESSRYIVVHMYNITACISDRF